MPRKPRIISSTGIYHIVLRSVNQHIIFEEDADFQKFLYLLSDCKMKYDLTIYAYCLMNNHIHLLLKSAPENLSSAFQSLGTKFVRWYNTKYVRTGHLFQERF
jgi:REP element-mobilizing transposase RayT